MRVKNTVHGQYTTISIKFGFNYNFGGSEASILVSDILEHSKISEFPSHNYDSDVDVNSILNRNLVISINPI